MTRVVLHAAELQQLHRVQLEMLIALDRICRQVGVRYQLAAGSLLGAVRHGGFIPWDDDIDVVMLRDDYQRFLRLAPSLLDERYFLQTWRSDPGFPYFFAKLRRHGSCYREECLQHSRQHHGIYIDIFPFDPVRPESRWWCGLLSVARGLSRLRHLAEHPDGGRLAAWRPGWQRFLAPRVHRWLVSLPPWLLKALQASLLRALGLLPASQVACLVISGGLDEDRWRSLVRPISEFRRTVALPFEGRTFPATADYHKALTRLYGDYMTLPPPARRIARHPVVEFRLPERDCP